MISADFQSSRTVAINATVHLFQEATVREFLIVQNEGRISAEQVKEKAELEYDRYRRVIDVQPMQVDKDLEAMIGKLAKKGWGK